MPNQLHLRRATEDDVPAITAIYNDAVLKTTATFDLEEQSVESRLAWFRNRTADFPVAVAEAAGGVVAYASLSRWSDKEAYQITAEFSLYVEASSRGHGIGRALAEYILHEAEKTGLYTVISRVTAGNALSVHLHQRLGFTEIGVMRRCGRKFGEILDVVFFEKVLK
jgi:phosphinothricin acetyltransferase